MDRGAGLDPGRLSAVCGNPQQQHSPLDARPGVSIFLQPSGYKGSAPLRRPEPGSNGMTLDGTGRLTVAGHAQRDV